MNDYCKDEINNAKLIYKKLKKMFPEIPSIPLVFKKLRGDDMGYLETSKNTPIKIVIDNSCMKSFDPDYILCHEYAHLILYVTKNSLKHTKDHAKLTTKLAKHFDLV